jgi:hypothetical protein
MLETFCATKSARVRRFAGLPTQVWELCQSESINPENAVHGTFAK